jgi:pyruvate ferredoxin oxidoreductase gamma subunit
MIEIRLHARAGQGMVTAAEILAFAANLDGKHSQAFPFYGSEKRGPPVTSYVRIDSKPIHLYEEIFDPDIVVVAEPSVLHEVDVCKGLKEGGFVLVNTDKKAEDLGLKAKRVYTINGTDIAMKHLGSKITNTVMLGAFVKASNMVKLESVKKALVEKFTGKFSQKIIDANLACIQESYDLMKEVRQIAHTTR